MNQEAFILPQQFGAKADGKADDTPALLAAVREASEKKLTLKLPEGEYRTTSTLILDHINIQSENAKISFYGMERNVPAVDMKDYVNIYGKLHIWSVDNQISNHGGRCGLAFGRYGSGESGSHCYVEEVTVSGGIPNANGVFITGNSHDIRIDKVIIPEGTKIGRGILIHWGNADQHRPKDHMNRSLGYEHSENAEPTKHPHDIHIGTLISAAYDDNNGEFVDQAAFHIAGGYNISCDEIIADGVRSALTITGGDCGFEFATPEEKQQGMVGLKFGKITGTNIGCHGAIYTVLSSYLGNTGFYGELEIEEINLDGCLIGVLSYGARKLKVGTMNMKNLKQQALHITCHTTDAEIDSINLIENCANLAAKITAYKDEPLCEGIKINTIRVGEGCGAEASTLVHANAVNGLEIGEVYCPKDAYKSILQADPLASNVHLHQVKL